MNEYLDELSERAKDLTNSIMSISIKSEGKLSLQEVFNMPYNLREDYVKCFNHYLEEKKKLQDSVTNV